MIRRTISILLTLMLCVSSITAAYAAEDTQFIKKSIPYPEGNALYKECYNEYIRLMARYKDDKTPIALSVYTDGHMWVTIPKENDTREIEIYIADEVAFPDDNGEAEFYAMRKMSMRGVIEGNHEGYANPFSHLTRAEAAAMVMRTLGIDASDTKTPFTDVREDMWYAGVINAAYKCGLVKGVTENKFSPNRVVTRQEATAMIARAVWIAGLKQENASVTTEQLRTLFDYYDADKVAPWALSAYYTMGTYNAYEIVNASALGIDTQNDVLYNLSPNKVATRYVMTDILNNVCEEYIVNAKK